MKLTLDSRFLHKPTTQFNCRGKVAVVFDSDRTLIPARNAPNAKEYLDLNLRAISDNENNISLASVITGRGNNRIKEFAEHYEVFTPLSFRLSTDTGRGGVFINEKGQQTSRWLKDLGSHYKCPNWIEHVEKPLNWNLDKVINILKEILVEKGFIERKIQDSTFDSIFSRNGINIYFVYDQALYTIKVENDFEKVRDLCLELSTIAKQRIDSELGSNIENKAVFAEGFFFVNLCPKLPNNKRLDKLSASEIVLSSMHETQIENLKGVIMLGDSINDDHLKASEFEIPGLRTIPIYSIFSGATLCDSPEFNNHPRLRVAEIESNISETLNLTINEILTI